MFWRFDIHQSSLKIRVLYTERRTDTCAVIACTTIVSGHDRWEPPTWIILGTSCSWLGAIQRREESLLVADMDREKTLLGPKVCISGYPLLLYQRMEQLYSCSFGAHHQRRANGRTLVRRRAATRPPTPAPKIGTQPDLKRVHEECFSSF